MISFLGLLQVSCNVLSTWLSVFLFISPSNFFLGGGEGGCRIKEKKNQILSILQRILESPVR